jgi:putative sterol carrier protein
MSDPVEEFFAGLGQRGFEPLLKHNSGSIRFDLLDGGTTDHWRVFIDKGTLTVGRGEAAADSALTLDRSTLVDVIAGKQNLMNVIILGQAGITGDTERIVSFQRLFGNRPEMATTQTAGR